MAMAATYPQVHNTILDLMARLAGDWEYDGEITVRTRLFGDLGFESLDLVVLGTAIQERFGKLPFSEFFAEIGQRPDRDLAVGDLVAFVCEHVGAGTAGGAR